MSDDPIGGTVFAWVIGGALLLALTVGGIWLAEGNDYMMQKFFAPRREAVQRQTFEQSKAFNQGTQQEMEAMQLQYISADAAHKDAIASIVLHRVADYDESKLTPDLHKFVDECRQHVKDAQTKR